MTALRVAIVCPYSLSVPGGVQNHALGLTAWLVRQGHDAHLVAPGRLTREQARRWGIDQSRVHGTGPAVALRWNGSTARVGAGPVAALRLHRALRSVQPDVVHVHEAMTPSIALMAVALSRSALVATAHTANPGSRVLAMAHRLLAGPMSRIGVRLAVSRVAAEVAERHGAGPHRVVPNGIDPRRLRRGFHSEQGSWPPHEPRICFVGRHDEPRKGLGVLLEAMEEVRQVHPGARTLVIGPGRPRQLEGVDFLGMLDDEARDRVLSGCDAYVAPHTGRESFGLVLLEAMACGAPVVAADLPAFREVVSDDQGPVAELFRAGDPQDLARALLSTLGRVEHPTGRGIALADGYAWDRVGPQVVQAYRDALRGVAASDG